MQTYPKITIIIVSLNAQRTIGTCLDHIRTQSYSNIDEILLVDGGSTDSTLDIVKKYDLPITVIKAGYPENQEARRAIGIEKAKNEICAMIDTDNYMLYSDWIKDMVTPLIDNKEVVASQTLRYAVDKNSSVLNRYFGLLGANDPLAYYLGKADRLSWSFDRWNLLGDVLAENDKYYTIKFDSRHFPTVGCNGIVFKKSILMKSNWKTPNNYFHTDVFVDIAKKGHSTFAILKNDILHDTADSISSFLLKRRRYMELHNQALHTSRRYKVFDAKNTHDVYNLVKFIVYSLTLIEPLFESVRGFLKRRDFAWFIHPIMCLGITYYYSAAVLGNFFRKK